MLRTRTRTHTRTGAVARTAAALAVTPAVAFAQCDQWTPVPTPNPSAVYNTFSEAEVTAQALHALLIEDNSTSVGNLLEFHVLRRDGARWTDLGGPGLGQFQEPTYFALHTNDQGVWLGGVSGDDRAIQDPPLVAQYTGVWQSPQEIELIDQVVYPFHDRGGKIYAMDTAPDGTMFAVGLGKGYGLTGDNSIPLFLVNTGAGWQEVTRPATDWPGGFSADTYLTDVIAFSSDNVWAVGWHAAQESVHPIGGLIVHWDGASLSIADDPRTSGEFLNHPFWAMDASGPDDIWAVGGYVFNPMTSTIAHYDGSDWTRVDSPVDLPLRSVAIDGDSVWAAPGHAESELAFYDGQEWSAAPAVGTPMYATAMARDPGGQVWIFGQRTTGDSAALTLECCRPDLDGNGKLDVFDFLMFQDLFVAGDPRADFDGNGVFDIFDFLAFQDAFTVGCP